MPQGAQSVDAKSLSIGNLLEERHPFRVPRYQRSYAWGDEAIDDFTNDIKKLLATPPDATSHFFGGLVCIAHLTNQTVRPLSYEVVDGQQRLATFVLALSCVAREAGELRDRAQRAGNTQAQNSAQTLRTDTESRFLYWNEADVSAGTTHIWPRLRLSLADDDVYQQLLAGSTPVSTRESHNLLIEAESAIASMITEHVGVTGPLASRVQRLMQVRTALTEGSHAIHIVSAERSQAYRLFSVLNDRGESLSDADLLRSRSLELLEGHTQEQSEAASVWDEMLATPARTVDAFFRALYPSFTGERARDDLFDETSDLFFPKIPPATTTEAQQVVNTLINLRDELQCFVRLAEGVWPFDRPPGAPTTVRAWQVERLGRLVLTLKHELALPLLLAAARHLPEKTFAELVYMLEVFAFRYKNMCNGHAGPPAKAYYMTAKALRNHPPAQAFSLTGLRNSLKDLILASANDQRFTEALREKLRYSNTSQRANIREFLTTIEDHDGWLRSGPQPNARPRPQMSKVIDINNATLEHIYPQSPKSADRDAALDPVRHLLGNLTFFGDADNVAAGNKPFAAKQPAHYATSAIRMTSDLATLAHWTVAEVAQREADLIAAALRVFVV